MPIEMDDGIFRLSLNTFRSELLGRIFRTHAPLRSATWNHDTGDYEYIDYGAVDDFKPYIPADFRGVLARTLYDSLVGRGWEPRAAFAEALRAYLGEE